MPKRSKYFDNTFRQVRAGYTEFSLDLVKNVLKKLKSGQPLNDSQKDYLIDCLSLTLDKEDANRGFGLSDGKKGKKLDTRMRDITAYFLLKSLKHTKLKYEAQIDKVLSEINKKFPNAPISSQKSLERIYTKMEKIK